MRLALGGLSSLGALALGVNLQKNIPPSIIERRVVAPCPGLGKCVVRGRQMVTYRDVRGRSAEKGRAGVCPVTAQMIIFQRCMKGLPLTNQSKRHLFKR
jgi:hypothetical protein